MKQLLLILAGGGVGGGDVPEMNRLPRNLIESASTPLYLNVNSIYDA